MFLLNNQSGKLGIISTLANPIIVTLTLYAGELHGCASYPPCCGASSDGVNSLQLNRVSNL